MQCGEDRRCVAFQREKIPVIKMKMHHIKPARMPGHVLHYQDRRIAAAIVPTQRMVPW